MPYFYVLGRSATQSKYAFDQFRLIAVLGQGNFGKVLLAEHKPTHAYTALKTFNKADLLRENNMDVFKVEKRVLATVTQSGHPCFVRMLGCMQKLVSIRFLLCIFKFNKMIIQTNTFISMYHNIINKNKAKTLNISLYLPTSNTCYDNNQKEILENSC